MHTIKARITSLHANQDLMNRVYKNLNFSGGVLEPIIIKKSP